MGRFRSFQEVLSLPDASLRSIVDRGGDAPERVWAAWALGMRRHPDTAAIIHRAAAREPAPGVRAHFALMLVAHGEIDAAAALARFDPDALVRATACRSLARSAGADDAARAALLVECLAGDPSLDVRLAICDGAGENAPDALRVACAKFRAERTAIESRADAARRARDDEAVAAQPMGPVASLARITSS